APRLEWLIGRATPRSPRPGAEDDRPLDPRAARLLSRAAFGARPGGAARAAAMGADAWIGGQLAPKTIPDLEALFPVPRPETVHRAAPDVFDVAAKTAVRDLRRATLLRAAYSERQLLERVVEFWSDHFTVFVGKTDCAWLKVVDDREVIRRHALGRFRDLLL